MLFFRWADIMERRRQATNDINSSIPMDDGETHRTPNSGRTVMFCLGSCIVGVCAVFTAVCTKEEGAESCSGTCTFRAEIGRMQNGGPRRLRAHHLRRRGCSRFTRSTLENHHTHQIFLLNVGVAFAVFYLSFFMSFSCPSLTFCPVRTNLRLK